jgi:2-polyprenyl-3-methyl-5-hydroxy-6-metoxy-1,4-benzoquinol methylase
MPKAVAAKRRTMTRQARTLDAGQIAARDSFAARLFTTTVHAAELMQIYLGIRLDYYDALNDGKPRTAGTLARQTGTDARYTREWLEAQATGGILHCPNPMAPPEKRKYAMEAGVADVLANRESLSYMAFLPEFLAATMAQLPALQKAYRTGRGIPWEAYGDEIRRAQGDQNRAFFLQTFAQSIIPSIPRIHSKLAGKGTSQVADIACGVGWSSIALAQKYHNARVTGFDTDAAAIRLARKHAKEAGVADRVSFLARDGLRVAEAGRYDLVTICEALHDMSHPVEVLQAARRSLAPGGRVLVMDENVLDAFTPNAPELERLFYGFSTLACLPNGRDGAQAAATGTVMRPSTLKAYASQAGFTQADVLNVRHDFFRFYELSG